MKRLIYGILLASLLPIAACSSDSSNEKPRTTKLPVPAVSVSVSGLTATVSWSIQEEIDNVRFTYELYREEATSPEKTHVTRMRSEVFELTAGVLYKIRVKTTAPSGSMLYEDSDFSSYVSLSSDMLNTPVAEVSDTNYLGATLVWRAVTNAAKYAYELYEGTTTNAVKSGETTEPTMTFNDLKSATEYRFRVKAVAGSGATDSSFSEEVSFETDRAPVDFDEEFGLPLPNEADGVLRAFPGAEGGGMYTTGGRGGRVIKVTNLNDSGPGSLRDAVEASGTRTVVFEVAGTIALKSQLVIRNGNLTIAGQTAPGLGIAIRDYTVRVAADNIIIRYMRFRMGDETNQEDDAIWGRYQQNIILDHCSMSWSTDECASFYANKNFTMQWCLLTESLTNSIHGKGSHGYGGIWGGKNASFHHNMLANHNSRNARVDHPQIYGSYLSTHRGNVDYRNNLIYNWGDNTTYGGEDGKFNIVANYYMPGPASKQRNHFVDAYSYSNNTQYSYGEFYLEDNYHAGSYATAINADNWAGIYLHQGSGNGSDNMRLNAPLAIRADDVTACYTSTHASSDVPTAVLEYAGASKSRDVVDLRAVGDARSRTPSYPNGGYGSTGGLIDTQSAVGGWPTLTATDAEIDLLKDTDGDGIPDHYEEMWGLDKNNAADGAEKTLDPQGIYTNLEVYLHYLVKDITLGQVSGATYKPLN